MSFTYMRMKNDSHIKGWALNLVLTQRPVGTRVWPIPPMWMHADRSQVELFICSLLMCPWLISKQLVYLVLGCSPFGDQTSRRLHPRVCHLCSNCYRSRKNTNRRILDKHSWSIWQEKLLINFTFPRNNMLRTLSRKDLQHSKSTANLLVLLVLGH